MIFTAATGGILISSLGQERLAKRRAQRTLIRRGFVVTVAGIGLLLGFVSASSHVWAFVPGLFVIGLGLGVMLTPSVNIVQMGALAAIALIGLAAAMLMPGEARRRDAAVEPVPDTG